MKTRTSIFANNLVNRYNMVMSVSVLEQSLRQVWDKPLPSSIGHDIHHCIAYSSVIALHLQPNLARLFGAIHSAESNEDMKIVQQVLNLSIARHVEALDKSKLSDLKHKLSSHLSSEAEILNPSCAAYYDKDLACRVFPSLFKEGDKDGLISLSELNCVAPGVFEKDGLLLFAHQYFRRSLSRYNTLNDPFLQRLSKTANDSSLKLDVRISLDKDLLGHPDTLLQNIELAYWWGPHFTDNLDDIRIGVTHHESSKSESIFNGVSATEFWWYEQNDLKTFECEEIRNLNAPSYGESHKEFGCRFVHSILGPGTKKSVHLDGAIRLYSEDLMLERVDMDIMHFGRRAEYTKLWRIDGALPVDTWKELISDYYRDNHFVGEYFGGKEESEVTVQPDVIQIDERLSIHEFAPCSMARGDGVRIAISYHSHSTTILPRVIVPTVCYSDGADYINYVEGCTIDMIKLLKRRGESVQFQEETAIVVFDDLVINLPMIEHSDADSLQRAQTTMDVIRDYCLALGRRGNDRMIGFHISVRFPDRDAHFSFAGQLDDMGDWLLSEQSRLPQTVDAIGEWSELAYNGLTSQFPKARNVPPLINILKKTGLLTVNRKFLMAEEFELSSSSENQLNIGLVDCPSIQKAMPFVKEKGLVPRSAFILKKSKCTKCHGSYTDCACIKIIDPDVSESIVDFEPIGVFWTDRPA